MAFANKDLQVGDLLITDIREVYAYLGFFEGTPRSIYTVPDYGHMYLFCDSWTSFKHMQYYSQAVRNCVEAFEKSGAVFSPQATQEILSHNIGRLSMGFDGNARYTKSYTRFASLIGRLEIPDREQRFKYVYGCRRLGDKKPRGFTG